MVLIKLKHVKNFRDIGGVKTKDGRNVKTKMLIRGSTLCKLTDEEITFLKEEYRLSTIIDLRTKKETAEDPDTKVEGVKYYHYPVLTEAVVGVSHEKKVRSFSSLKMMPRMEDLYVQMVKGDCLENLVTIMKTILTLPDDGYSLLFHCSVGKDRTGVLAALILSFLGVDRDTVIYDYLISNKFTRVKSTLVYLGLLCTRFNHKFAKKIRFSLLAKQRFIESALESLESDFGSLDNFFKEKLCFTPEETEKIKNRFLC